MTSVARKIHMPRLAESRCCSSVAKWCSRAGLSAPWAWLGMVVAGLSDTGSLLVGASVDFFVVISFPGYDGLFFEIESGGRRLSLPLEAGGVPWVVGRGLAVAH